MTEEDKLRDHMKLQDVLPDLASVTNPRFGPGRQQSLLSDTQHDQCEFINLSLFH